MEKYGFIYLWYDKKFKRFYVGCHWGTEDDGYICSSSWMKKSYRNRPNDFKRRILRTNIQTRSEMYIHEQYFLSMIKQSEIKPTNIYPRYYNLSLSSKNPWHQYPDKVKTVGQRISVAKKGKKFGPRPEVGPAISAAKKGKPLTEEHKAALRGIKKSSHTEEWKKQNSVRMLEQWSNGTRKRAEPKQTMTREEQDKLCSHQLKNRWADPIWSESQKAKLKAAWVKRREKINNNV